MRDEAAELQALNNTGCDDFEVGDPGLAPACCSRSDTTRPHLPLGPIGGGSAN